MNGRHQNTKGGSLLLHFLVGWSIQPLWNLCSSSDFEENTGGIVEKQRRSRGSIEEAMRTNRGEIAICPTIIRIPSHRSGRTVTNSKGFDVRGMKFEVVCG